jgi:membrane protein implicated in regulation of membrane protease activity
MLYWGFGFLAVGVAAFIVGFGAGVPGLGTLTNVAFFLGLAFLAAGVINGTPHRHHAFRRHAHR